MNKLTTHKGDTLLLIEVPLDAYGFKISVWSDKSTTLEFKSETFEMEYDSHEFNVDKENQLKEITLSFDENFKCEIIGTTSTLTDEQVKELIKDFTFTKGVSGDNWYKCDTLNEFLEANNIDTSKEYVILKLLNNE
jgi:hypothetical protein